MGKITEKTSYIGDRKMISFENERIGEYGYINGEWIWIKNEV